MTDKKQNKKKKSKTKTKDAPLKTPVSLDDVRYTEDKQIVIINNIQPPVDYTPELRTISLYGDISERKGAEVVAALLYPDEPEPAETTCNFSFGVFDPVAMPILPARLIIVPA